MVSDKIESFDRFVERALGQLPPASEPFDNVQTEEHTESFQLGGNTVPNKEMSQYLKFNKFQPDAMMYTEKRSTHRLDAIIQSSEMERHSFTEKHTRVAYRAALDRVQEKSWRPWFVERIGSRGSVLPLAVHGPLARFEKVVQGGLFQFLGAVLILANVVYICILTDLNVRASMDDKPFVDNGVTYAIDLGFTVAFVMEVAARVVAYRALFWDGPDWKWNLFDFVVVLGGVVEFAFQARMDFNFLRILRFMRMMRTVEIVRNLYLFSKLRLMLLAVLESIVALSWALVLLVGFMVLLAVLIVQTTATYISTAHSTESAHVVMSKFFHSLPMAVLTLFMCITGGVNWWEIQSAFMDASTFCAVLFPVYVAVMILALLNIVTGVFVNDSIEVAQSDRELRTMALLQRNEDSINGLREMFKEIDTDKSGTISLDEFMTALENTKVRLTLEGLGVDTPNAVRLFETLDIDGDLQLEIDEFVMGCSALCCSAKTLDMEMVKSQNKKIMHCVMQMHRQLGMLALNSTDSSFQVSYGSVRHNELPPSTDLFLPSFHSDGESIVTDCNSVT